MGRRFESFRAHQDFKYLVDFGRADFRTPGHPAQVKARFLHSCSGGSLLQVLRPVRVRQQSTFLRCTADADALQPWLPFLDAECCPRNKALKTRTNHPMLRVRRSIAYSDRLSP